MKSLIFAILSASIFLASSRNRAGSDAPAHRGRLHHGREGRRRNRLGRNICPHVHSSATRHGRPSASNRTIPARETWYAEPAKVADNFYFLGTKIHSAWALVGSQGIIIIEALFDYAAPDEILGGLKKLGLDSEQGEVRDPFACARRS